MKDCGFTTMLTHSPHMDPRGNGNTHVRGRQISSAQDTDLLSTGDRFHDAMKREIGLGDCLMYVNIYIYRYVYLCTVYITWQNIERVFPKEPFSLRNAWRNRKCFAILLLGPWTTTKLSHFIRQGQVHHRIKSKETKTIQETHDFFFATILFSQI